LAGNLERGVRSGDRTALLEQSDTLECSRCRERVRSRKVESAKQVAMKHMSGGGETPSTALVGTP